jgi:hypothetical protein
VTCVTVSNVRVTFREIQETILLDFQIAEAGIRQIVFRLPASLKDAHISAPRIREQSVVPVEGADYVRVTLDLQDAITGDYRVVVENDARSRLINSRPLPLVDPARRTTGTSRWKTRADETCGRACRHGTGDASVPPVGTTSRAPPRRRISRPLT